MADKKSFYITTTIPYVNADPHIGFAMELVRADVIARFKEKEGYEVFFNTGVDEHGKKVWNAAKKEEREITEYLSSYADKYRNLLGTLGIKSGINFIRTTDKNHEKAAQAFWKLVDDNGYIYKKAYEANYCVGCESEKTNSELVNGKCPVHPHMELEKIEEENYFFRFSSFADKLLDLYEKNPNFVIPEARLNEMKEFVKRGLEDFSISRLKKKMGWGVPVPDDPEQVMYVWFDALVNYISSLGWPFDLVQGKPDLFNKFWINGTPVQYCGKDNTRFQGAMWQAMLMAAGLPTSHTIVINGFVTAEGGVKMSKSLGNVVNPVEIVEKYGADALRYFLTRELSTFEDSPFTLERFGESYNANLANGLGNLVSRIMKLAESNLDSPVAVKEDTHKTLEGFLKNFEIQKAMNHIWSEIGELDKEIQEKKPWESKDKDVIEKLVKELAHIGYSLSIFMPETSRKIIEAVEKNKMPSAPLFLRIEL